MATILSHFSHLWQIYPGPRDPIHPSNLTYSTTVLHSSDMVVVALHFTPVSHSIRDQSLRLASFLATLVALHFTPVSESVSQSVSGSQFRTSVAWSLRACLPSS